MNPTIELLQRHGSVRKFKPDAVPPELVEKMVHAAQRASTSSNLQVVSVVAVTEPERKAGLAAVSGQEHVAKAPLVLIWCADLRRLDRACELRGYVQNTTYVESFLMCVLDVGIAAQNAVVAAESVGLGVCYLGSIRNDAQRVIDLLQLPRLVVPIVGMAVGWPAAAPLVRPRLPASAVLYWEHYDREHRDPALLAYDREMVRTGVYEGRQVPVPGKPGQMEDYGWLEHSARRAAQAARTELRGVLARQGFALE